MTGNAFYDACRMFKHACSFLDCAVFCEREPKFIRSAFSYMDASIVNSAFSCEVFIKSLLIFNGMDINDIRGHKLEKLWKELREQDLEITQNIEQIMKDIFGNKTLEFENMLKNISNAFEYWRYIYEHKEGTIHLMFLRALRDALKETCCEKYYNMTWSEYVMRYQAKA